MKSEILGMIKEHTDAHIGINQGCVMAIFAGEAQKVRVT